MSRMLLPPAFVAVAGSGPALALASAPPRADAPVLVVALPRAGGAEAVIRAAGATPVGPRIAPFAAPHSVRELRDAGAWLVRDGAGLARYCGAGA